jgi:hypothetical protein
MTKYTEKKRTVEASQWQPGAKGSIGIEIVPYVLAEGQPDLNCTKCGELMSLHGKRIMGPDCLFDLICPGTYIVIDDGRVQYRTEEEMNELYE